MEINQLLKDDTKIKALLTKVKSEAINGVFGVIRGCFGVINGEDTPSVFLAKLNNSKFNSIHTQLVFRSRDHTFVAIINELTIKI